MTKAIVSMLLLLALSGCETGHKPIYQRFVPIGDHPDVSAVKPATSDALPPSAALALDTKTGRVCLTYIYNIDNGYPQWRNLIPPCADLYKMFPD